MGNSELQPSEPRKPAQQKFSLQLRDREIILDFTNRLKIVIGDILSFPSGGFEGLHLWDSNIILARYILRNKQQFSGKSVVQLLSGTGIASIAAKKFTSAAKIAATDKRHQVIQNLNNNCLKNGISSGLVLACLSMSEHVNYKAKYDFVMGADILCRSVSLGDLEGCIVKLLDVGGQALFVVPYENLETACEFIDGLDPGMFSWSKQKLVDQIYLESPLLNQVQGFELFRQIAQSTFFVYRVQKLTNKEKHQTLKHEGAQRKASAQLPKIRESMARKSSKNYSQEEDIKIKDQIIDDSISEHQRQLERTQQLKKQLEVVTLKADQDLPQYERRKQRDLADIINSDKKAPPKQKQLAQQKQPAEDKQGQEKEYQLYDQPSDKKQKTEKNETNLQDTDKVQETQFRKKSTPH